MELKAKLQQEANHFNQLGAQAVKTIQSPLVREEQFEHQTLANAKTKNEFKKILQQYIADKLESIEETREDLNENPDRIYELDALMQLSLTAQNISPESILGKIVAHKTQSLQHQKTIKAVCITVMAVAVTALTFGGGAFLLVGGLASAGLSAYGVYEAIEDYKQQNAANDVGLLSEDPSLAWVIMAIVGAGLDAAALNSAFKNAAQIAKAGKEFNAGGNAAKFNADLRKIAGLHAQMTKSLTKAAKEIETLKTIFKSSVIGKSALSLLTPPVGLISKIIVSAIYTAKSGAAKFKSFLFKLQGVELIKSVEGLTEVENEMPLKAFENGRKLKDIDPIVLEEINKFIAEGKLAELDDLIKKELIKLEKGAGEIVKHDLKWFAQNVLPDVTISKQLQGKGQIRDLLHNPNVKKIGIEVLLEKTPRQIEVEYKNYENIDKTIKQINKAFEDRDLNKGH